ncbi:COP9 signalosome-like protein complex subunit 1 [Aulographum hederae CBS 113979]|uniref:COP9 signalosome-like protein complex subunit 1 n=1 Tax=Aulographum hederae CBS 113979 TaxID=1176131 RepID=A0A6G1HFM6_9PEZI|nr:COP9 signalosome-like protein complex subunit 1 [Aulographum hederae CBS 113979]
MAGSIDGSLYWQGLKAAGHPIVQETPKLDLDTYIANYEGRTRLERLEHIASTSTVLAHDALKAGVVEAKNGKDVDAYVHFAEMLQKLTLNDPLGKLDQTWVDTMGKKVRMETERLEQELKTYKNNLIRESIRMGNNDLGNHYYAIGEFPSSYRAYVRMRDYCTTPQHVAEMNLRLLLVTVAQRNWMSLHSHDMKIRNANVRSDELSKIIPILHACGGLALLENGSYAEAAKEFLNVPFDFVNNEAQGGIIFQKEVITGNDVAIYGGLCALASMDRETLRRRALENTGFRQFLELEPQIRRAITMFCRSKYSDCLSILQSYMADYALDIHLHRHIGEIYHLVRSKSMVEYFIPFSVVTLDDMQKAFPSSEGIPIEDELVQMIQHGELNARIDLVDRLLTVPTENPRASAQVEALESAADYERQLRLRMTRMALTQAGLDLKVKGPNANSNSNGAFDGGEGNEKSSRKGIKSSFGGFLG